MVLRESIVNFLIKNDFLQIEWNAGRLEVYKFICNFFSNKNIEVNFFFLICQSTLRKQLQIESIRRDLGETTIWEILDIRSQKFDDWKLWIFNTETFNVYPWNGILGAKTKGGDGIMLVSKSVRPKIRNNLKHTNIDHFVRQWIEWDFKKNLKNINKQFINISYNPSKKVSKIFLDTACTTL